MPLAKRAPQRQAYRLVELKRFSEHLGRPLNLHPRYFPVASDDAAKLIIAVDSHDGSDAAMRIAGAILRGVWVEEKNIADPAVLQSLLEASGLPARRLDDSQSQAVHERYEQDSQRAIDSGVFGAPTYVARRRDVLGPGPARLPRAAPGRAADAAPYIPYFAFASLTQALLASPVIASHFSAATL